MDSPYDWAPEPPDPERHRAMLETANAYAQSMGPPPPPPPLETHDQRVAWSVEIADLLVSILHDEAVSDPEHSLIIDECWIGAEDLALYVRYSGCTGCRVADLHLDTTQGGPARSADHQASDIYHDLYGSGPTEYVDERGFAWFRCTPEDWAWAVQEQARLYTAWPPPADPVESAHAVAAALAALAADEPAAYPHDPTVEECRVGEDLALYIRYRYNGATRGHRAADLGRARLAPEFGLNARNLARQIWLELGSAPDPAYVDSRGYGWSGDAPAPPVTWAYAIEHMPSSNPR